MPINKWRTINVIGVLILVASVVAIIFGSDLLTGGEYFGLILLLLGIGGIVVVAEDYRKQRVFS